MGLYTGRTAQLRDSLRRDWREKPAGEVTDHDVLRGLGFVDWTVGIGADTIRMYIWGDHGPFHCEMPKDKLVEYRR